MPFYGGTDLLLLSSISAQLVPAMLVHRRRLTRRIHQERLSSSRDLTDASNLYPEPPAQLGLRDLRAQTKKQLVIVATIERQLAIVAANLPIRRGQWQGGAVDCSAHATSFKDVPKILPKPVADIDGGRGRLDSS
jgi:hypothetical protein